MNHPDFRETVFFRDNYTPLSLINLYQNKTCYIIGNAPSLAQVIQDKELYNLLLDHRITKYCMNNSAEELGYNCNLWSCLDRPTKFSKRIFTNPNIMKLIPTNRYFQDKDKNKIIAYKEGKQEIKCVDCPNTIAVNYRYQEKSSKNQFIDEFITNTINTVGLESGHKSVLVFTLKNVLLLGFSKIILIGVDLNMSKDNPYYHKNSKDYSPAHINHNNRLYGFLRVFLDNLYKELNSEHSRYNCKIYSNKNISGTIIPKIDLKKQLLEDLKNN